MEEGTTDYHIEQLRQEAEKEWGEIERQVVSNISELPERKLGLVEYSESKDYFLGLDLTNEKVFHKQR